MAQTGNSSEPLPLCGIVLAAGAATRFGSPKQIADVDGETMLARAVRHAAGQCTASVVVVTGAHCEALAPVLAELAVRVVHNHEWQEGMGASIRAGMKNIPENSAGVLLMLCDQPAITTVALNELTAIWQRTPQNIAAAHYAGSLGVPAVFPPAYWPQLRDLRGDHGAKQIMLAATAVSWVDMPAAALDVDTPEQLHAPK